MLLGVVLTFDSLLRPRAMAVDESIFRLSAFETTGAGEGVGGGNAVLLLSGIRFVPIFEGRLDPIAPARGAALVLRSPLPQLAELGSPDATHQ